MNGPEHFSRTVSVGLRRLLSARTVVLASAVLLLPTGSLGAQGAPEGPPAILDEEGATRGTGGTTRLTTPAEEDPVIGRFWTVAGRWDLRRGSRRPLPRLPARVSAYNSEEHSLVGDRGAAGVTIPSSVSFPQAIYFEDGTADGYADRVRRAKRLAAGFETNVPDDYDRNREDVQDHCYWYRFGQHDFNRNIYVPIPEATPDRILRVHSYVGAAPTPFTFGELVALYGDYRRTTFCDEEGRCYLSQGDIERIRFDRGTAFQQERYCPDPVPAGSYLRMIAGGLVPPYGSLGNATANTADEDELDEAGWWGDELLRLAAVNDWHFSNVAVAWYVGMHRLALLYADRARNDPRYWTKALHYEANALHSLTDVFAFGHLVTHRDVSSHRIIRAEGLDQSRTYRWMENVVRVGGGRRSQQGAVEPSSELPPIRDMEARRNDFLPSYARLTNGGIAANTERELHDRFNRSGADVRNLSGAEFHILGDGALHPARVPDRTLDLLTRTVRESLQALLDAHEALSEGSTTIEELGSPGSSYFRALLNIPVFVRADGEGLFRGRWARFAGMIDRITGVDRLPPDWEECQMPIVDAGTPPPSEPEAEPCDDEPPVLTEAVVEVRRGEVEPRAPGEEQIEPSLPEPDDVAASERPTPETEEAAVAIPDLLVYDDLRVYFQPARDTIRTAWRWRIVNGDSAVAGDGLYVPSDTVHNTTRRAPAGAPAPFQARPYRMWGEDGTGGGRYRLETCKVFPLTLLGQINSYLQCGRKDEADGVVDSGETWQVEGEFEVGEVDLVLKDFVAERGAVEFDEARKGQLRLEAVRLEGESGTADAVVSWSECVNPDVPDEVRTPPCQERGEDWREVRRATRTRVRLGLPGTLSLREELMGELDVRGDVVEAEGERDGGVRFQLFDLMPGPGVDRELAVWSDFDSQALVHPPHEGERRYEGGQPTIAPDGRPRPHHLHQGFRREAGAPERPLGELIRDPATKWYIPVKVAVDATDLYAFAVYGVRPGPYDGEIPTAPGAVTVIADADPGGDDPSTDPDADRTGGEPGRDQPGEATGDRRTGPIDPAALDPNAPDVTPLIREWISVAAPPNTVEDDVDWHYDEWGRQVGERASFIATADQPPDDRGARTPVEYVWDHRDELDSVDHCTLGEYVTRSLSETSIADCRGRYTAAPRADDFTGRKVAAVKGELEAAGHTVEVSIGAAPTEAAEEHTVVSQRPGAGEPLAEGATVHLTIYGPFTEAATVPDVTSRRADEAKNTLEAEGFDVAVVVSDPATSPETAYTVVEQQPSAGAEVSPGARIRLTIRGPYSVTARVPRLLSRPAVEARERVSEAGLVPELALGDPAPTREEAGQVVRQEPGPGAEVEPGSTVRLTVYGPFDEERERQERCTAELRRARAQHAAGDYEGVVRTLSSARRSVPCDDPAFDEAIGRAEDAIAERERRRRDEEDRRRREEERRRQQEEDRRRQQERVQRCNALLNGGQQAYYDGRLQDAYRQYSEALRMGCSADAPLGPFLQDLEREIQERNRQQSVCGTYVRRARSAFEEGRFQQAQQAAEEGRRNGCRDPELDRIAQQAWNCESSIRSAAEARNSGEGGEIVSLILGGLSALAGCNTTHADEIIGEVSGGRTGGPAVDVERARTSQFVGTYQEADPTRTREEFRGTTELKADGTCYTVEYADGQKVEGPCKWSWDPQTKIFTIDWSPGGRFEGPVAGNTHDFIISGHWNNGQAGRLRLHRR